MRPDNFAHACLRAVGRHDLADGSIRLQPVDVAHAALLEAGRPDLAEGITWWVGWDGGGYLEFNDDLLSEADWDVITRAETLARASIGLPPIDREDLT
jgi:hypothetical protein